MKAGFHEFNRTLKGHAKSIIKKKEKKEQKHIYRLKRVFQVHDFALKTYAAGFVPHILKP